MKRKNETEKSEHRINCFIEIVKSGLPGTPFRGKSNSHWFYYLYVWQFANYLFFLPHSRSFAKWDAKKYTVKEKEKNGSTELHELPHTDIEHFIRFA